MVSPIGFGGSGRHRTTTGNLSRVFSLRCGSILSSAGRRDRCIIIGEEVRSSRHRGILRLVSALGGSCDYSNIVRLLSSCGECCPGGDLTSSMVNFANDSSRKLRNVRCRCSDCLSNAPNQVVATRGTENASVPFQCRRGIRSRSNGGICLAVSRAVRSVYRGCVRGNIRSGGILGGNIYVTVSMGANTVLTVMAASNCSLGGPCRLSTGSGGGVGSASGGGRTRTRDTTLDGV